MRHCRCWLAALSTVLLPSLAAAERHEINEAFPLAAAQSVAIDFPVGELEVVGSAGERVEVDIETRCDRGRSLSRCERDAREIRVETRTSASRLTVRVTGYSTWNNHGLSVHGTIRVPRGREVFVDMGVGELTIEDTGGDLVAELGVGELEIVGPEAAFASALLDAGIGDTSLRTTDGRRSGRRSFLLGSEVQWRAGQGRAALRAEVGVGEVTVRLQ
jgi:hypothetical protein